MPSCVMRYCTNYTTKTSKRQGITYHSFPRDELRLIEWVDIVRKQRREESWQPNKSSKVCSVHFKVEDKSMTDKGYTLLKKTALPALDVHLPPAQSIPGSPNSLAEENLSDLESIFDSPREAALKKCVERIRIQKENLIKRNRILKKQNIGLRRRVAHLSEILKRLKTKKYTKIDTKKLQQN